MQSHPPFRLAHGSSSQGLYVPKAGKIFTPLLLAPSTFPSMPSIMSSSLPLPLLPLSLAKSGLGGSRATSALLQLSFTGSWDQPGAENTFSLPGPCPSFPQVFPANLDVNAGRGSQPTTTTVPRCPQQLHVAAAHSPSRSH